VALNFSRKLLPFRVRHARGTADVTHRGGVAEGWQAYLGYPKAHRHSVGGLWRQRALSGLPPAVMAAVMRQAVVVPR